MRSASPTGSRIRYQTLPANVPHLSVLSVLLPRPALAIRDPRSSGMEEGSDEEGSTSRRHASLERRSGGQPLKRLGGPDDIRPYGDLVRGGASLMSPSQQTSGSDMSGQTSYLVNSSAVGERLHGARILLVDDHEEIVEILTLLLERAGYRNVRSTTDPREVLGLYREFE